MSDQIIFLILRISLSKIGRLLIPCVSLYCRLFRQKIGRIILSGTFAQNCCSSPVPIKSSFWDFCPNFPFHLCHPSIQHFCVWYSSSSLLHIVPYLAPLTAMVGSSQPLPLMVKNSQPLSAVQWWGLLRPYLRWWGGPKRPGFPLVHLPAMVGNSHHTSSVQSYHSSNQFPVCFCFFSCLNSLHFSCCRAKTLLCQTRFLLTLIPF